MLMLTLDHDNIYQDILDDKYRGAGRLNMGSVIVKLKVYGPEGRFVELDAIVDAGATFTKIPRSMARELGLDARYEVEVELGDGRIVKRGLALGEVEIEGIKRPAPITIGENDEKPIIGYNNIRITKS